MGQGWEMGRGHGQGKKMESGTRERECCEEEARKGCEQGSKIGNPTFKILCPAICMKHGKETPCIAISMCDQGNVAGMCRLQEPVAYQSQ